MVLLPGNLSTARFWEPVLAAAPDRIRMIAPEMRGFGDSEQAEPDATRGLRDRADDVHAPLRTLGVHRPVHLVGWSTGPVAALRPEWPVQLQHFGRSGRGSSRTGSSPCGS